MFSRSCQALWVAAALLAAGCDRMQLLAPTSSTITVTVPTRVLPTGGSKEITAFVMESSGTPVQNGTTVRFSTTLGRVDPVDAQTRNGFAVATFFAGDASGVAEIRATSGGAGAASTAATTNVVQISVGGAAVESVTVRANPAVVSSNGSTVDVIATVMAAGARLLSGIPVSFSATRGTLSNTTAVTQASGDARVALTTNADTDITATTAGKTSNTARVTAQAGPSVTLSCAVGTTTNCATVTQGHSVTFAAQRGTTTSNIRTATLEFGEGSSVDLGSLSGPMTVPHAYSQTGTFTARLIATDVNNETTTATQVVRVGGSSALRSPLRTRQVGR